MLVIQYTYLLLNYLKQKLYSYGSKLKVWKNEVSGEVSFPTPFSQLSNFPPHSTSYIFLGIFYTYANKDSPLRTRN